MSLYGVIGYYVTVSEGHMIASHPPYVGWLAIMWLSQRVTW